MSRKRRRLPLSLIEIERYRDVEMCLADRDIETCLALSVSERGYRDVETCLRSDGGSLFH